MDGTARRLTREHNDRAWAVWHTANLTAYAPRNSRQFIRLKTLTIGNNEPRRQTVEEQIHIARQWTAALAKR